MDSPEDALNGVPVDMPVGYVSLLWRLSAMQDMDVMLFLQEAAWGSWCCFLVESAGCVSG